MIDVVYEVLSPLGVPINWNSLPDIKKSNTVISYHFFNEGNLLYGDGEPIEEGGTLQVDVYSVVNYSTTVRKVKKLLNVYGFRLEDARDDREELDENTMLYHKILIFNYIESEVKRNGME